MVVNVRIAALFAVLAAVSNVSAQTGSLALVNAGMTPEEVQFALHAHSMLQGTPATHTPSWDQSNSFNRRSRNTAADTLYHNGNGNDPFIVNAGMTPEEVQFALHAHSMLQGTPVAHVPFWDQRNSFNRRSRNTAAETLYHKRNGNDPFIVNAGMTPEEVQLALHAHSVLHGTQAAHTSSSRRRRLRTADSSQYNYHPILVNADMTPEEAQFALHAHSMLQGTPATHTPSWNQAGTSYNRRSRNAADKNDDFVYDGNGAFIVHTGMMTPEEMQFALDAHNIFRRSY